MIEQFQTSIAQFVQTDPSKVTLAPLAGDASTRQYWRVHFNNGAPYPTAILMWMPENSESEPLFINVQKHLYRLGVHVPKVYQYNPAQQTILLEDCSDNLLQNTIQSKSNEEISELYTLALNELFKMHASPINKDCVAFNLAFDIEKFNWELNFFKTHTLKSHLKRTYSQKEENSLSDFFLQLSQYLSNQPRYFTHRDYHSRNLIVQDNRIRVIDFQDARMGPAPYDLVSLIYDAYVRLPEEIEQNLITQFKERYPTVSDQCIDWMLLQRSLKAAGTFGYMAVKKNKTQYLQYLPRVFNLASQILEKYPEFKEIKGLLQL